MWVANIIPFSILRYFDESKGVMKYYVVTKQVNIKNDSGWQLGWEYREAKKIGSNSYVWDLDKGPIYVRPNSLFDSRWIQAR